MIAHGKMVSLQYSLTVDGEVIDTSQESEPLVYVHGSGQIIPGLENELEGLKQGDKKQVLVKPQEGYGEVREEAILQINRDQLPNEDLRVGNVLQGTAENGHTLRGVIRELHDDYVRVDFNHPLAGKELHFEVEVISITDPPADESQPGSDPGQSS